jgi:hypothetical protein
MYYHPPALEKLKINKSSSMNNSLLLLNSSGKYNSQVLVSGGELGTYCLKAKIKKFKKKK